MKPIAIISHSTGCTEDWRGKSSFFHFEDPVGKFPLFLVLVLPVHLLWCLLTIGRSACGWHTRTSKYVDLCRSQKPLACVSRRASGNVLAPLFRVSPDSCCRSGSTSTSLQTVPSSSASRSRISLCRCITKPPLRQIIAWSTSNASPQTHVFGRSEISQLYLSSWLRL